MNNEQRKSIQELYENKGFADLIVLGETMIGIWESENTVGETEFETIRNTMEREFKIKGVIDFFHTWYQMAYDPTAKLIGKQNGTTRTLKS